MIISITRCYLSKIQALLWSYRYRVVDRSLPDDYQVNFSQYQVGRGSSNLSGASDLVHILSVFYLSVAFYLLMSYLFYVL